MTLWFLMFILYLGLCPVLPSSTQDYLERLFGLWSQKLMNSTMTIDPVDQVPLHDLLAHRLAAVKPRLHQRNMLHGNKLRGRATCCGQQVACCPQHVARLRNNFVYGNKQHVACCAQRRATCCAGVNAALGTSSVGCMGTSIPINLKLFRWASCAYAIKYTFTV